jgi:hypothetical protein
VLPTEIQKSIAPAIDISPVRLCAPDLRADLPSLVKAPDKPDRRSGKIRAVSLHVPDRAAGSQRSRKLKGRPAPRRTTACRLRVLAVRKLGVETREQNFLLFISSGQPFSAQNTGYEPLENARQGILFSSSLENPTFHTARTLSGLLEGHAKGGSNPFGAVGGDLALKIPPKVARPSGGKAGVAGPARALLEWKADLASHSIDRGRRWINLFAPNWLSLNHSTLGSVR